MAVITINIDGVDWALLSERGSAEGELLAWLAKNARPAVDSPAMVGVHVGDTQWAIQAKDAQAVNDFLKGLGSPLTPDAVAMKNGLP